MNKKCFLLFFFFFALLLPRLSSAQIEKECLSKMRTGKFTYPVGDKQVVIKRTQTEHVESADNGKSKLILSVEWEDEKTYKLTHRQSINMPGCLQPGDWIRVRITECFGNHYKAEYTSNGCGSGQSTFVKLK